MAARRAAVTQATAEPEAHTEVPAAMVRGPMQRIRYEFVLEAHQPINHQSETIGNEGIIMRRKVRQKDGWAMVPEITGDTMRHQGREALAWATLDAAGLIETPSVGEGAMRLLFNGGMVTGRGDGGIVRLDRYRELCALVPGLALFGGCCDNRVIPGRLIMESATLICAETTRHAEPWQINVAEETYGELESCRAHIDPAMRVRMDPVLSPEKRGLLTTDAQIAINARLTAGEAAHEGDDAPEREKAKSTMMPRTFERIAEGSLFYWAVEATCYSPLEVDTFNSMIAAMFARCHVGGKKGTGHGLIKVVEARVVPVGSPAETVTSSALTLGAATGQTFRAHVSERKAAIAAFFADVNA